MNILWTDNTAAQATAGKARGSWQAARVEIDSRRVQPGDLFVAIRGERFDGHEFVKDALAKGAVAAMVSVAPKNLPADAPLIMVEDTLKGLEALGRFARARTQAGIVGITGSVGKTSAKEMLRLALAAHGRTFATSGNYNNHIGTPLNLANLPPDTDFAVFEMGMNHAGEISHLTRMVQPHIAAITNVEAVHLEFFPSLEAVAHAKSEIFEGLPKGGVAVVNAGSPQLSVMMAAAARCGAQQIVTFGANAMADCRLLEYHATASGCEVTASIHGAIINYTLGAIGKHWALTSVMILAITHALELDDAVTARALAGFRELEGRGRLTPIHAGCGAAILIDDSYNASPAAMKAAFAKTSEVWEAAGKKGRRLAALGDMLELGSEAPALHAGLAKDLQAHHFDAVYTAGAAMQHLHDALPSAMRAGHVAQARELPPLLINDLRPGDVLLVKGSHGSKMYEVAQILLTATASEKKHAI
jgi:UDP-N-acetylmuramoyl-tripeptide--D-alanyl-D-alanine ligase